ncbi:MAG: helix-turn-helix transcriptional regulator [Gemmataceae bacterium]|nr:helix-turn-helix transcriptional regulator [Gemmataceae bacterium]
MANLLNNLLRRLREAAYPGESIAAVADRVGVDRAYLAKYENGTFQKPPPDKAKQILAAYQCGEALTAAVMHLVDLGGEVTGPDDGPDALRPVELLVAALTDEMRRKGGAVVSVRGATLPRPTDPKPTTCLVLPTALVVTMVDWFLGALPERTPIKNIGRELDFIPGVLVPFDEDEHLGLRGWEAVDVTCVGNTLLYWHLGRRLLRATADERAIRKFAAEVAALERLGRADGSSYAKLFQLAAHRIAVALGDKPSRPGEGVPGADPTRRPGRPRG